MSYDNLVRSVLLKLGLEGVKQVKKFFYCIPITVLQETVKYGCFTIGSDEDLQVMFHCRRQFPEVRTPELLAKLVDVCMRRGYNRGISADLFTVCCTAWGWRGLLGDPEDDDVEPNMIDDDSGDDIGEGVPGQPVGFGARDAEGTAGLTKLQVGQQFQDKDEALLSVKTYSICRGVQYKVVESDYRRYVGKCSEFGNGCTWLIRLSLRQRKGIWEVKWYNGPHTCLATSISSDHRSLDYHVISAFIMPMVRADASVSIKVLLNATAAHFGFRPTYRRV
ncbi:uncharacterized protein LOC130934287 [Arachis stenosperma]|uniref:uncharacterized protein LOC130934287 n=1 Tax=Arachis stenosperma TaxID=217475 RepID=UPI0025AB6C71|nr:uncharacterized protein LOC130934287 [Arachis stenosperma]